MIIDAYIPAEYLERDLLKKFIPDIKKEFSHSKEIPSDFEIPFYIAIAQFPELQQTTITMKAKSFDLTLQAQPASNFLFSTKKSREYKIFVNDDANTAHGVLFQHLPFDAQVGIMAHELSHIADYTKKTTWEMVIFILSFLGIKFRERMERLTDQEVIARGFGWQLYEWADFAMYKSSSPRRHKYYKLGYYLSPENIIEEIRSYPELYKSFEK